MAGAFALCHDCIYALFVTYKEEQLATSAIARKKIELHDGTDVNVRSLSIKNLRIAMQMLKDAEKDAVARASADEEPDEDEIDLGLLEGLIEIARFCLNVYRDKKEQIDEEEMEELVDMPTVLEILKVCADIELGNQMAGPVSPLGTR